MASVLDIVNQALIELGQRTLAQLTPATSKAARIANSTFADHRDHVLQEHTWKFATSRLSLPANAEAPIFGALYAYPLPADVLRVEGVGEGPDEDSVGDPAIKWREELHLGVRSILTDEIAPLPVIVIVRVTDMNATTPSFRAALATYCASQWAESITGTQSLQQSLLQEYTRKLNTARSTDARSGGTRPAAAVRGGWLEVR